MKQERIVKAQSITKNIVSRYIVTELKEFMNVYGIITITEVIISNDLSYMDIHVSSMKGQDTLTKDLAQHAHPLQRMLGKEMAFIKVPKIRFKYDDSGEKSSEIYTTIKDLNK